MKLCFRCDLYREDDLFHKSRPNVCKLCIREYEKQKDRELKEIYLKYKGR